MIKTFNYYLLKLFNFLILRLNINNKLTNFIKIQNGIQTIISQELKYESVIYLEETECKIFSQNGEDGIINFLRKSLNIENPNFVEIGVGDYSEANTRFLYEIKNSKGTIIDVMDDLENKVKKNISLWKGDLNVCQEKIESENINYVLKNNCNFEIDIFSLDIDGIDYWIADKINSKISKIFILEYNSTFGPNLEITVPNIRDFKRSDYHYSHLCYGASLKLLINLMKRKGYYFVGSNSLKNNAFFINNDYKKDIYFPNIKIKDLNFYTDSNIRESRTKAGKLNFLSGQNKLNEIKDCEVIDLKNINKINKSKISNLI
tara:strand:- start:4861 stop:5814 length:954 start_codon:yes stop_codon:yes gene_type:complete